MNHGLESQNLLTHDTPAKSPNKAAILKPGFNFN